MVALIRELQIYEIILIILGIVLFFVLIRELSRRLSMEKPINVLISFFILPIVMIGFPAYENIEFLGFLSLQKETQKVVDGRGNKRELLQIANSLSEAGVNHPRNLVLLAKAFEAGGDLDQAKGYTRKVIDKQPSNNDALRLQSRLSIQENMNRLKANPGDVLARQNIQNEISRLEEKSELETTDLSTLARGNMAIGNTSRANMYADSVQRINPRIQRPF